MKTSDRLLARLDRIPVWPYPYTVLLTIGLGFFFAFFDIVTIGLSLPTLMSQFGISLELAMWTITSSLIGYIIGSFLDSRISDLFGRRLALLLSIGCFSFGSLLSATSPSIEWLIFWRFIIGMGVGSEIANVTTYMGELAPAQARGRFTSIAVGLAFLGFALVPFVALWLVPNYTWGWRALFCIGGLGALIVMFGRRYIPDSIRWLISQGRLEEAEATLQKAEALGQKRWRRALPEPKSLQASLEPIGFWHLFKAPYLKPVVWFAVIWFLYYIGNYGWLTLNTKLLLSAGMDLRNSLTLVAVGSFGFVVGSILAIFFGDKVERKTSVALCAFLWTAILLVIGWWPGTLTILVGGFLAAVTISFLIPLLYAYTAECFPTRCRATALSITDGIGHLGGAFCGQIIMGMFAWFASHHLGFQAAFTTMALTGLLTGVLVLFGRKMTGRVLG